MRLTSHGSAAGFGGGGAGRAGRVPRVVGREQMWGVFEARVLGPTLEQREPISYAELVDRFKLESPAQASNLLVSGKRMFIRALHSVVAEYGASEEDVEQEIADLQTILAQS